MNHSDRWIGLDVGGANIKASNAVTAVCMPFPLWRDPAGLESAIRQTIARLPAAECFAATMTGELADCYASKSEGVRAILDALQRAVGDKPLWIATNDDRWVRPGEAGESPQAVAAANWRLLARLAARLVDGAEALVIDVGSTTIDLTRVSGSEILAAGVDDTSRLMSGGLLYQGVRRTPLCAIVDHAPYRDEMCPVAAEFFATTGDAWLMLGVHAESSRTDTADGKPFDRQHTRTRLARCFCADDEQFDETDAHRLATHVAEVQTEQLCRAIERTGTNRSSPVIAAGEGEFLVERAHRKVGWAGELIAISSRLTPEASECGPAWAAACLAAAELSGESIGRGL